MRIAAIAALAALLLTSCSFGRVTSSRHALVYGVSLYSSSDAVDEGSSPNLTYTDDDAFSLAALLEESGWNDVRTRIRGSVAITPESPTKAQLQADIEDLAGTVSSDDTVLIYFSSHGGGSGEESYLIPYEGTDGTAPDLSKCVYSSELSLWLSALPTDKIIVIIDACYSGGFVTTDMEIDGIPQNYSFYYYGPVQPVVQTAMARFGELLALNAASKGQPKPIVLSAAGSAEFSYEDWAQTSDNYLGLGHGIFTYYLLQSATEGDGNGDGYITTSEAYAHAVAGVNATWNSIMLGSDFMPHLSGGSRDLVLFDCN